MLAVIGTFVSCDKWVNDAITPKDTLTPTQIVRPRILASVRGSVITDGPLIANVRTLYGEAIALSSLALGSMSDELTEGQIPNSLLYRDLSADVIKSNSGSADALWTKLQDYLARSRELLEVEQQLVRESQEHIGVIKAYTQFMGHLNYAESLRLLASTFSTTPSKEGGSIRVRGRMLSHQELLQLSEEHYFKAIEVLDRGSLSSYQGAIDFPLARSASYALLLRLRLAQGRYEECASLLDKAWLSRRWSVIYNAQGGDNPLYTALNRESRDVQVSPSLELARQNKAERLALPLEHKVLDAKKPEIYNIYVPSLTRHSELIIIDDIELLLVKAELIVRGFISGDALREINSVISRFDASSQEVDQPSLSKIAHLRRIYLALRGQRTLDLRRGLDAGFIPQWKIRKNQWIPLPERELEGVES